MEKETLRKLQIENRDEAVRFLKSLWLETPQPCPLCGGRLDFYHKKAKKSNSDWSCTGCGERFEAVKILKQLNEEQL